MTILQWFMAAALLVPFGVASAATSNSVNVPITITAPAGVGTEEFVGPFANWLNVKTTAGCGATGTGSTDDTTAIQNCINKLSSTTPVLYFPAGTYCITSALSFSYVQYMSLIGADPSTTTIKWCGAANSPAMLLMSGTAFSKISRLTFNGNSNVGVIIDSTRGNTSSGYFPTGNEISDDVLSNAGGTYNSGHSVAFACGYTVGASALVGDTACSEVTFLRDRFANAGYGVESGSQNAVDIWVWYSTFTNMVVGLNSTANSDIQAFHNNFFNSSVADINIPNSLAEVVYSWNYSSGSKQFINCVTTGTSSSYVIEGNTIVNTASPQAIDCGNQGPNILIDNAFYSGAGTTPVVRMAGESVSDLLSTGNTFSTISGGVLNACSSSSDYVQSIGRCHAVGDQTTSSAPPSAPALPGPPPQYCAAGCPSAVSVTEVNAAMTTAEIQTAITNAAAAGSGAVVHLQAGNYSLTATLTVPGNAFIQIIGDGFYTQLIGGNPVLSCGSACKAWFRDFWIWGNNYGSSGIRITGADQVRGRVFIDELHSAQNVAGLQVNGLNAANVEVHDSTFDDQGFSAGSGSAGIGINVIGGSGPSSSFTNVFAAGADCIAGADVQTSGNANFTWRHSWHDAGGCLISNNHVANISGNGTFAMVAARPYLWSCDPYSAPCTSTTGHYFNISNFSGISLVGGIHTAQGASPADVYITGTGGGNNLVVGYQGCNSSGSSFTDTGMNDAYYLLDSQVNSLPTGCVNQVTSVGGVGAYLTETSQNVSDLLSFLNTTLAPLRSALPTVPGTSDDPALASGVTDARIYRVFITQAALAVDVEP